MGYPTSIDSPDTTMQGTSLFTGDDHSLQHRTLGSAVIAIETTLGTNSASNVIQGFTSGQQAVPINSGTLGTVISKGTINGLTAGTPNIQGGTIGTTLIQGGTASGITVGSTSILQPLNSAFWVTPGTQGQVLGTNILTQINWGSVMLDLLGEIGTTNNFVAKQGGIYQFNTYIGIQGPSDSQYLYTYLNGTAQQMQNLNNQFGGWFFWMGSVPAGGTVNIYVYNTDPSHPGTLSGGIGGGTPGFYGKRVF